MNSIIERVNAVCQSIRSINHNPISFKKLITCTRRTFKQHEFDIAFRTRKDRHLGTHEFYVMAYYDAEDDYNNFTPIEVVIHHNFADGDNFSKIQISEFLVQIFDAVVHEFRHRHQSTKRNYQIYSNHHQDPYKEYLSDPDEVDAYAVSIAIELLRVLPKDRAIRYLSRVKVLAKMRKGNAYASANLQSYIAHFDIDHITKTLTKKVYKHLLTLDIRYIFV